MMCSLLKARNSEAAQAETAQDLLPLFVVGKRITENTEMFKSVRKDILWGNTLTSLQGLIQHPLLPPEPFPACDIPFFSSAVFSVTNNLCCISCKIIDWIFHVLLVPCSSLQGCFPSLLLH